MIDHGKDDPIPYHKPTEGECALHEKIRACIADRIRQLNERDEALKALQDMMLTGTGWMRDGKRIDPREIHIDWEQVARLNERDKIRSLRGKYKGNFSTVSEFLAERAGERT